MIQSMLKFNAKLSIFFHWYVKFSHLCHYNQYGTANVIIKCSQSQSINLKKNQKIKRKSQWLQNVWKNFIWTFNKKSFLDRPENRSNKTDFGKTIGPSSCFDFFLLEWIVFGEDNKINWTVIYNSLFSYVYSLFITSLLFFFLNENKKKLLFIHLLKPIHAFGWQQYSWITGHVGSKFNRIVYLYTRCNQTNETTRFWRPHRKY